jgi:integrase
MSARPWDRGARGWFVRVYTDGKSCAYRVGPPGEAGELEAERVCAELNRARERERLWTHGDPSRPLPLDALLWGWHEVHGPLRSERTHASDRALVERLARHFGPRDARTLTDSDLRKFASVTLETRAAGTVQNALSILRRVLNLAVRDGLLKANPVPTVGEIIRAAHQRDSKGKRPPDAWTHEEADSLLRLAAKHEPGFRPALLAGLHTGMRRGELLALRWEDVDSTRGRVYVRRAARLGGGTKDTKTGRDRATPLSRTLADELREQRRRQERATLQGSPTPEWVFASPRGHFWQERNFTRTWERLRRKAGKEGIRPLGFHSTRHTFITWALEAGHSPKRVAEWVGASPHVIHRHYSHLLPEREDAMGFLDGPNQIRTRPNQAQGGEAR